MEEYLKKIKDLEKNLDKKLEKLEFEESENETEVAEGIKELSQIIEKAKNICTTPHEEKYLRQYASNVTKLKNRFALVKNGIDEKKMKKELMGNGDVLETTAIELLMKEGESLDKSLGMGKSIMESAHEVKMSLAYQKEKVLRTSDKIVKIVEMVPGISGVIGKISRRNRFNAIIIGLSLFICMVITIIYLF